MRRRLRFLLVLAAASGCGGDATAPDGDAGALRVAFVTATSALQTLRSGSAPASTAIDDAVPFAAIRGGLVLYRLGGLSLYYLDGSSVTLPIQIGPNAVPGAVTPDGARLAFVRPDAGGDVFLHIVRLDGSGRDSVNLSQRASRETGAAVLRARPVWSPTADTVAFLVPNATRLDVVLYAPRTQRVAAYTAALAVAGATRPLDGWPMWDATGGIRFLAWRWNNSIPTDSLVVMRLHPEQPGRPADLLYAGESPDSLPIATAASYSFADDGRAVVFALTTGGRTGIFALRDGAPALETLLFTPGSAPAQPLAIP